MGRARVIAGWIGCTLVIGLSPAAVRAAADLVALDQLTMARAKAFAGVTCLHACRPAQTATPSGPAKPAPAAAASATASGESIAQLAWLVGDWAGTMGKAGIEEHWIPAAGKAMLGVSRTVVGDRMVAFEFLRIEQRPDAIVYVAQPNGRPPTEFRMTKAGPTSVTFENPQHDHPKIIRYTKESNGTLVAEIEGDEKGKHVTMRFAFSNSKP